MTTYDPTVQRTIDDAGLEAEMEQLFKNKPSYREAIEGTNADIESGKMRAVTSTAAEVSVWNRETGESSIVIFDALRARMRQRFPEDYENPDFAGSRVYTMHPTGCTCGEMSCDPAPPPIRGHMACPLSLESDRTEAEAVGFGRQICRKPAVFMSQYDVDLHVEKAHPRFYRLRNEAKYQRLQDENRQQQTQLAEALMRLAERENEPRGRGRNADR